MSPIKLAAAKCVAAALVVGAASLAGWSIVRTGAPVTTSSQAGAAASPGNEERLQRAMTFTAPVEAGK